MASYPHLSARVFDTPLLMEEARLLVMLHVLGPRLGFDIAVDPEIVSKADDARESALLRPMLRMGGMRDVEMTDSGYVLTRNGTAVIPILGTLVHRSSWMDSMSGMQSYQSVLGMVQAAQNDYKVRDIVFDVDSPGGETPGAFDTADAIFAMRGNKPMTAVASEHMASAAFLIASAADEIVVPRTGNAGSVGVVMAHVDMSKALEKKGIAVTYTYAGAKKIDGNKFQPPSESFRAEMRDKVDSIYQMFTDTVARNRRMSTADVRATEAGMFMGRNAVDVKFADRVNTLSNELSNAEVRHSAMQSHLNREKEAAMAGETTTTTNQPAVPPNQPATPAPAAVPQQQPAQQPAQQPPTQPAQQPTQQPQQSDERARVQAILQSPEAENRTALAQYFAFQTSMSSEQSIAALKAAPKEPKGALAAAMANRAPNVPSQENGTQGTEVVALNSVEIYARREQEKQAYIRRPAQ